MSDPAAKTLAPSSTTAVSVVMCTYNGAHFVKEQIASILSQTYPLHELLIFDDASTDDTARIVAEIILGHPFAKLIINERNKGFAKNFEQALKAASGQVIAISDQDDIWLDNKIEKLLKAWRSECPMIYCASKPFQGSRPDVIAPTPSNFRYFEGKDARKIFFRNTVSGHNILLRQSFLAKVLPLPTKTYYDWFIAVVAAYNGGVQFYPEIMVLHRMHGNNATMDTATTGKKYSIGSKQSIIDATQSFMNIEAMPLAHKNMASKLCKLMQESLTEKFSKPLFSFLFKYRSLLFNYKRRKIGFFSHLKHSYRIATQSDL